MTGDLTDRLRAIAYDAAVPVPEKGTRWRRKADGVIADFTDGVEVRPCWALNHDGRASICLTRDWQERWSEIPPRGCPEIGEVVIDDLTDRLRKWEHIPLALEAADEIDRLRSTIAALLAVPDESYTVIRARMAAVVGGDDEA